MKSLIWLAYCLVSAHRISATGGGGGPTTNSTPKRPLTGRLTKVAIGSTLSVPALVLGKQGIDGPEFREKGSLVGHNILITGGSSGLGKESAVALASFGARVVILTKTAHRGVAAVEDIKRMSNSENVSMEVCDLTDLRSIDACAKRLLDNLEKIDVLINNAGVMAIPTRQVTEQGFEKQFGINHLGHFALTRHLLPHIEKSDHGGRIINISSAAHWLGKLDRDDLLFEHDYSPWPAYARSKLANILFTKLLAMKLKAKGSKVLAVACHPGICRTSLIRYVFDADQVEIPNYLFPILGVALAPAVYFTKSAEQGAQTQIFLSASSSLTPNASGRYYDNSRVADTSPESKDAIDAEWLWQTSETLIGKRFDV